MSTQAARVVELVETATGDRYQVRREKTPAQSFGRRFTVIFDERVAELATVLGGHALRVFLSLPVRLDFRTWKRLPQSELAEALGTTQSAISRGLRELLKHKVVEKRGTAPMIEWRLCRTVGYRGTVSQFHAEERTKRMQQPQDVPQPALKLGPMRVVKGGKKPQHPSH